MSRKPPPAPIPKGALSRHQTRFGRAVEDLLSYLMAKNAPEALREIAALAGEDGDLRDSDTLARVREAVTSGRFGEAIATLEAESFTRYGGQVAAAYKSAMETAR